MSENANVIPFVFREKTIRVIEDGQGDPWWVAKDVCEVLGHTNPSVAMDMLDEDERAKKSLGRQGDGWTISESGLYTLIIRSNKPEAKAFRRWITHEVLPAIRKTGRYVAPVMNRSERSERICAMADAAGLKTGQRIRLLEIAQRIAQLDDDGQDMVLNTYADLCGAVGKHKDAFDDVAAFVESSCVLAGDVSVSKDDIFDAYTHHAEASGIRPASRPAFFSRLYRLPGIGQSRPRDAGARSWHVTGIRLTD